jgi:hypothetical protein
MAAIQLTSMNTEKDWIKCNLSFLSREFTADDWPVLAENHDFERLLFDNFAQFKTPPNLPHHRSRF